MNRIGYYEIRYQYDEKEYSIIEQPQKGWEAQFLQNVLDRIESITNAGGTIVRVTAYKK